jgi:mono/diheme cytochrome c family protein
MRRCLSLFIVVLSVWALLACGNSDSASQDTANPQTGDTAANTNATITGSAIKGPIDSAEMKLFYFSDDGTETEIVAENAPVLTSPSGAYEFQVDPQDLENIQGPLVMKSVGGVMGGQPAPELKAIISDPSALKVTGDVISRHLSTASSVAADMLENRVRQSHSAPQTTDAEACTTKVENALEIDLDQDPADVTQAVAMVNLNVDENLDLFNTPRNNDAVGEYIEYMARNLDSSSGMWDDKMEDPQYPGEDKDADFNEFGEGHLEHALPQGPSRMMHLMVKVDKKTILNDGVDTAAISLKLINGWGRYTDDEPRIDLAVLSGQGQLNDTNPLLHHGRARVTLTSTSPGDVMIQASYTLDNGNTIAQEVVVTVVDSAENAAPVANAGDDQNVSTGTLVTLDGSQSSDVNNDPLTYSWVLSTPGGSNAALSDPTIFNPTFTPDVDGTYVAELVVNDGAQDSAPSSVTITAASGNSAPTADAGPDQNVATGSNVVLDGSGSKDADNDPLTYSWTIVSKPAGSSAALSTGTQPDASFTADVDGAYTVQLIVGDGTSDSVPSTVTITASSGNSAPTADAGLQQNVATGSIVTLDGSGSKDADNDPLTYSWTMVSKPAGSSAGLSDNTQVNPYFTADADGTYVIELVVNDGTVDSAPATVSVTASTANSAPTANAGPDQTVDVGSEVSLDGTGSSDADSDPLTYAWTLVSKPAGSTAALPVSATTEMVFFTPDVAGTYVVQLVVNDGSIDSTPDTVTITATAAGPDGAALFSANCAACHGADGTKIVNLRGISASTIEAKMPHNGNTIDSIGGSAGAQAIADFLAQ